jgi:hypothetical protein
MTGWQDGQTVAWESDDWGDTWTAWGALPDDAWEVRAGGFGMVATGEHPSDRWDVSQWSPTVIEQDGLTLSIDQGPDGLVLTGADGEPLLSADLFGGGSGPASLALPSFIAADNDRGVFTVTDPESGDPLMTISYREMQDAFDAAQGPGGLGPNMFVAYSADGGSWSEASIAELVGAPGWVGPVAVGDDFALMMAGGMDGPSSLWRGTTG